MADNLTLNAGSGGATLATDEVGTDHYQRVKLTDGTADSSTAIAAGGGVEANALRVTIASDSTGVLSVDDNGGSLTVDGTVTANLSATDNAVLDSINTNTGYGAVVGGGVEATALRVTLASDSTGVLSVDDNGGSLTIDGTVTANLGATDNAVLDQIVTNTTYGSTTGGGTETGAVRVTIANDSTGVLSVDDNGSTLSIDDGGGAITVDNAGTFATQATLQTGSNLVGDVGLSGARTSGGTTPYYNDGTVTLTQVKASAGQLYWLHVMNLSSAVVYLQLFNVANGSITLGTTTPTNEFAIPTQGDTNGAGFTLSIPNGIAYGTAINYAVTTTQGGATTVSANACLLNLGYA